LRTVEQLQSKGIFLWGARFRKGCEPKVSKEKMEDTKTTVSASMDITLAPTRAFDVFIEELTVALAQKGMGFEAGTNGRMTEGEFEVGRVVTWKPGELTRLEWHQADWKTDEVTEIKVRFEQVNGSAHVTMEHRGWGGLIGDPGELVGWGRGRAFIAGDSASRLRELAD
jgi:activator of HSP90 ATPase